MWSGPILGLLCGTPTYRSAARYIDWSPTHWIIIMFPIKIAGGINLIRHSHIPMLGGPLAQSQGILRVPPATPQCWPIAWSAASRKGFVSARSWRRVGRKRTIREDKWCVTMCHRKLVFHLTLDSVGGCASDHLWSKNSAMMTLINFSRFMTRGRSSFQWLQWLQCEKFRSDIGKLRIAQNCGFLRTGVRRRGSEPMARQGDFRLDPKPSNDLWDRSALGLTTHVVLFLYLTSNWNMTGSCIISYIHIHSWLPRFDLPGALGKWSCSNLGMGQNQLLCPYLGGNDHSLPRLFQGTGLWAQPFLKGPMWCSMDVHGHHNRNPYSEYHEMIYKSL